MLKPLDVDDVCAAAQATYGLVTLEEHSVLGGLGAAVTEITSEHQPTRVLRIGVPDRFSEHCGSHAYLLREHGLSIDCVRNRIGVFCQLLASNSIALA
jgi:transketolase